jgi:small subunit ribosomal protein S9
LSNFERPEDEERGAEETPAVDPAGEAPADESVPEAPADESVPEAPAPDTPAEPEAAVEPEAAAEPEAAVEPEAAAEPEPTPAPEAADEPEPTPAAQAPAGEAANEPEPTPAAAPDAAAPGAPAAPEPAATASTEAEDEDDRTPRLKPEIPGADLEPDIVPEGEQFLDAEAQAAAEAEAEAAAARAQEAEEEAKPIADAAIDLAAGARYTSTGKRKTAVARVTLKPGTGTYSINGKELNDFFPRPTLQRMIRQPLETVGYEARMDVVALMHGGGVAAQAGALRHGISRALLVAAPNLRGELKRRGFLTRDPRVKERKKAGLKKARKRPQFSKR